MNYLKTCIACVAILFCASTGLAVEPETIVLQNGKKINGQTYEGCKDAHTFNIYNESNFCEEEEFLIYNCQS